MNCPPLLLLLNQKKAHRAGWASLNWEWEKSFVAKNKFRIIHLKPFGFCSVFEEGFYPNLS